MNLLTRMLIACLTVWFIDQVLVKFGIKEPAVRTIQIIVIILAAVFILLGWYVKITV